MEKTMKERSSESHASSLADGRFYSDFYPRSFIL